jgi:hypothetical protein
MTYSAQDIENKLDQLAQVMAAREDRDVYLPLFQRLEAELAKLKSQETDMDRILQRAALLQVDQLSIAV